MPKKSKPKPATPRKRVRDAILGAKTPRPDWRLGNVAHRLEKYLKIAPGSVVFYGPDGKPANPSATLGSLREKSQTKPNRQPREDMDQTAYRVMQEVIRRGEASPKTEKAGRTDHVWTIEEMLDRVGI